MQIRLVTPLLWLCYVGQLESTKAIVKSFTCDQHPLNRSLYQKLGITPDKPYIMSPTFPNRRLFGFPDFVHIFKNFCFNLMDHAALLASGLFVSKQDWMDLLTQIGSEITPGFRFSFISRLRKGLE